MPTDLNDGYENNINVIQIRVNGAHSQRVTDRLIPGTAFIARSVISEVTETDGGVHSDSDVQEYTVGGN